MREIILNGYIDEEMWYGDEITPEGLHDQLYPQNQDPQEELRIILNSYGGSCNAAVRMFDDIRAYPGAVHIIVSGTAASAATVLAMAADRLEMTQGSLWMIHDPLVNAWGNEHDLEDAIRLLRACKESILNVYARRCKKPRSDVGEMMRATTWMDASQALTNGFIDGVVDLGSGVINAAVCHEVSLGEAKEKVQAWIDRSKPPCTGRTSASAAKAVTPAPSETPEAQESTEPSEQTGVPVSQLLKRLELIKPRRYAVGIGFKGETDEENIRIIRDAIAANTPVVITPDYESDRDY